MQRSLSMNLYPVRLTPFLMNTPVGSSVRTIGFRGIPQIQVGFSGVGLTMSSPAMGGHHTSIAKVLTGAFLYYERYRLGGIDTVRGYEDFEIFPRNANGEINFNGGNKVLYANLEYRIPLANQLTAVAFFDVGQVWDESVTNVFSDFTLKKGAGVGVRFDLMGMLA